MYKNKMVAYFREMRSTSLHLFPQLEITALLTPITPIIALQRSVTIAVAIRCQSNCKCSEYHRRGEKSGYLIIFELKFQTLSVRLFHCAICTKGCHIAKHFSINAEFLWPITNLPDNRRLITICSPYYYYVNALIIIKFFANHPRLPYCILLAEL